MEGGGFADEGFDGWREQIQLAGGIRGRGGAHHHSHAGPAGEQSRIAELRDGLVRRGRSHLKLLAETAHRGELIAIAQLPREHRFPHRHHDLPGSRQTVEEADGKRKHGDAGVVY